MLQEGTLLLQGSGSKLCPNPMRPEYRSQAKMTGLQSALVAVTGDRSAISTGPTMLPGLTGPGPDLGARGLPSAAMRAGPSGGEFRPACSPQLGWQGNGPTPKPLVSWTGALSSPQANSESPAWEFGNNPEGLGPSSRVSG